MPTGRNLFAYQLMVGDLADSIPKIGPVTRYQKEELTGKRSKTADRLFSRISPKRKTRNWSEATAKQNYVDHMNHKVNIGSKMARRILELNSDRDPIKKVFDIYLQQNDILNFYRNALLLNPSPSLVQTLYSLPVPYISEKKLYLNPRMFFHENRETTQKLLDKVTYYG